jgi:predicted amidohydrolase YtcJ
MKVFYGDIVTCDEKGTVYQYLVEDEGKIVFVGDKLPRTYMRESGQIDLGPKAILPAFGDGHIHFSNWAIFNSTYDVRAAQSIDDVGPIIKEYAERDPGAKVLVGFGYSKNSIAERRLITRTELDDIVKDRPIYLINYDGHSAVANSAAIGLMPMEIRSLHGFNLESGQLFNEAFLKANDFITNKIPVTRLLSSMVKGMDTLAGYGVGLVHPVEGVGFPRDLDVDVVRFVARSAQLEFRVYFQTMDIKKVLRRKLPRIGGCFACQLDGCFGAKDAALLEPYSDDPENRGILFYSDEKVIDFVKAANRAGLQVQMHCIGDAAVNQAVRAIESALEDFPRNDHRHTLIHACMIPEETLEIIAALKIGITLQPAVLTSPLEPPDYLEKILGDRFITGSPLRKMVDMGIHVSGGSDGPVTIPDPIEGIHAACNQHNPDHSLNVHEALRLYTYNIAYTSFDEKERGTLEEGKAADMVILNRNPLKLDPADLLKLKVEKLYMAGREYEKGKKVPQVIFESIKKLGRPV